MFHWLRTIRWSAVAFGVSLVLGLLSMGLLGVAVYLPVCPVLWLTSWPTLNQWQGDWVWPAMIMVGMAWSIGFLVAGVVNRLLLNRHPPLWAAWRRLIYVGVLWVWALMLWALTLASAPMGNT